ncbi:MAG: hypothetical protein K8R56_00675, partial [Candidatus Eisenbacteria bacterium]|nr:hypothetical protein [Candidatus Eisenbacteria bacterium]
MREPRLHALQLAARLACTLILGLLATGAQAQVAKWIKLPPPAKVGVHVYDSLRNRELFLDEAGIVAASDAPEIRWERVWIGVNPALDGSVFAFFDAARDRIWFMTTTVSFSTPVELWSFDLSADPMEWTQHAVTGLFPDPITLGITGSAFAFDPIRDRVIAFGGLTTCNFCYSGFSSVYTLSLAGTPHWSFQGVAGTAPAARMGSAMVYDPWRDRMIVYGGLFFDGLSRTWYDDTWALSLAAPMTWQPLTSLTDPPIGRIPGPALLDSLGRRMIVMGAQLGPSGTQVPEILTLDLSAGVPANRAEWGTLPTDPSRYGALFVQRDMRRVVSYDGTDQWNLLLGSNPVWNLAGLGLAGSMQRRGMVAFVDAVRQRVYAGFGGSGSGVGTDLLQVRPLDRDVPWARLAGLASGPSGRYGAVAVVDPVGDRALVFGGAESAGNGDTVEYSDLWSFDLGGSVWTQLTPPSAPNVRAEAVGVFDTNRRRLIVHGGRLTNPSPIARADTWIYDVAAGTWSQPDVGTYGGVWGEFGVYDPVGDRMITFGPGMNSGLHTLSFAPSLGTWQTVTPTGTPPSAFAEAAAYDSLNHRILVLVGTGVDSQIWSLSLQSDPPAWSPVLANGVAPPTRYDGALVVDAARERALLFGGGPFSGGLYADTWAFYFDEAATPTQLALIDADATPEQVTLRWYAGSAGAVVGTVYRRAANEDWQPLAEQSADGTGVITYVDRAVEPGA